MQRKTVFQSYPVYFLLFYGFTYMLNAIYFNFIPLYLKDIGYTQTLIGFILAMGPFIAIIGQPIWGMAGDQAQKKNTILKLLLIGSTLSVFFLRTQTSLYILMTFMAIFAFFQTSINPISDAITLEYLDKTRWKFGPIRMAGTIGYALMALVAGMLAKKQIDSIFLLYLAVAVSALVICFFLPEVQGHQLKKGLRIPFWRLFADRKLILFLGFTFFAQMTIGYFNSFFPIYLLSNGGDSGWVGWAMFISAISEVPFLLFADRILKRTGVAGALQIAGGVTALRWLAMSMFSNPYVLEALQLLHGFSFVVLVYSMATYINREAPIELKATGQAINGLVSMGIARILANLAGGYLSDVFGIRRVLFGNFILLSVVTFVFIFLWRRLQAREIRVQ